MAHKPGLPTVPRGLPPALTSYLQSLDAAIRRIVGQARGTEAVSTERGTSGVPIRSTVTSEALATGSVSTDKMANASVTTEKIAKGAVTGERLGDQSVASTHLTKGCVTTEKLEDDAVTGEKIKEGAITDVHLAAGLMPSDLTFQAGAASDGMLIEIPGAWKAAPAVFLTSFTILEGATAVGPQNLREVISEEGTGTGRWQFDAAGAFSWCAVGYAR